MTKSNGKTYHYFRKGILSDFPYIRPGKNCVIIPPKSFNSLDVFFKTGKNPSHYWRAKGDWKAVFYMDEKNLEETQIISAIKDQISRTFQHTADYKSTEDLATLIEKASKGSHSKEIAAAAISEAEKIVSSPWFKDSYANDNELKKFFSDYKTLKGLP